MTVPLITGTDCPHEDALARDWSIVVTSRLASPHGPVSLGYVGRIQRVDAGAIDLLDAFDYQCVPSAVKTDAGMRVAHLRTIMPVDGIPIARILVHHPSVVVPLADVPPRILSDLRATLVQAWEARAHLRKAGARVSVIGTSPQPR